jgi:hypothetical protein
VTAPTVFAVAWSGAKKPIGIWVAAVRDGVLVESRGGWSREDAVAYLASTPPPVIAGFDFSFGVPAWFARELGCTTIDDVWTTAARDGEDWLRPTPPFWRTRCLVPPERRFRRCEQRFPTAKSVFQLVGNGQVGAGSVRGMPLLAKLHTDGFAIWPFDAATDRTALEIYPRALRPLAPCTDTAFTSNDERDAVSSAFALWEHSDTLNSLPAATDPLTRLEGDVWMPSTTST